MQKLYSILLLIVLMFSIKPVLATVVIFEGGFGQGAETWDPVLKKLPKEYKIITYTRPSLTSPDAKPTTVAEDVDYLINLVEANQGEDVILVGHSYGGLVVSEVALQNPELIDGVVLLEPAVRGQRQLFKAIDRERIAADDASMKQYLPGRLRSQFTLLLQQLDTLYSDTKALPHSVPVVLFTSTKRPEAPLFFEETEVGKHQWLALHLALIASSENAMHIRSTQFGHQPHKDMPGRVAQSIISLVSQNR